MRKKLELRIVRAPRWRQIPRLLQLICLVYLLALPSASDRHFTRECESRPIAATGHDTAGILNVRRRDEICAAVWLAACRPIILCRKEDEEIDPRDMPPGTKVWIYLRHSPGDNQTLESQEAAVRRFAQEKGWIVDRVFRDRWASGKSTKNREEFEHMIYLARQKPRPADLLIIWSFARFARDQDDSLFYRAELRINGWQILSMMDDIPSGCLGRIFEALIDWKNERFLKDLRANTIRGLRYIAEQGCLPGGKMCRGYTTREVQIGTRHDGTPRMGRKPELDPDVEPLVVKAFEMKARGAPYAAISRETGLYSPKSGSWNHLFRNRVYIGEYKFQGEVFTNVYPGIISKELFETVQKRLPKRKKKMHGRHHPRRKGSSFFLANIGVCAYCGEKIEGKSAQGYRYYVCARHNEQADLCPESGLVPADAVEEEILRTLLDHVLTPDYLHKLLKWTNECLNSGLEELTLRIEKTRSELAEAERLALKMARNFSTMETPTRSAERLLREQDAKVAQLQMGLAELEREVANSRIKTTQEEIEQYVQRARAMIDRAEFFDLRGVCEQLCSRIVMSGDECRIELHFPAL